MLSTLSHSIPLSNNNQSACQFATQYIPVDWILFCVSFVPELALNLIRDGGGRLGQKGENIA